jgi:hypothetical protein
MFPRIREWGAIRPEDASCRLQPSLWDLYRKRTPNGIVDDGYFRFWDFDDWGATADSVTLKNGFGLHIDTGNSISQVATEVNGVIRLTTTTTDNNSIEVVSGGGDAGCVKVTSASSVAVAFDSRVRFTQVSDTYNMLCALIEEGTDADNGMISDAGALADKDIIGFRVLEADGDDLEFCHKKAGQTVQATSGLKAILADTWYRLGWLFDPSDSDPAKRLKIFIDDVIVGYVSDTAIAAATFPSGEELALGLGIKNQTNVGKSWDIDCAAVAMAG